MRQARTPGRHILFFSLTVILSSAHVGADPGLVTTRRVPMRDGVELATDVYLPASDSRSRPCLLVRTPYGRTRYANEFGIMARWGYAVAIQDLRGRYDSDGKAMGFEDDAWGERRDGQDTVEWLIRQPFCNGKVGTVGASAMGIAQYLMAPTQPAGLVCQYVLVGAPSLYHHGSYHGGVLREKLVRGWMGAHAEPEALAKVLQHRRYDLQWKGLDMIRRAHDVRVPILHYGGWYDIFARGTIDAFVALQETGGEGARGRQVLVMGPWVHGGPGKKEFGDFELPEPARRVPADISARRWFDFHLRGITNGMDGLEPVIYYVMGPLDGSPSSGNVWRTAKGWPPLETTTRPWYLTADGALQEEVPSSPARPLRFRHDPEDPVPSRGGANLYLQAGPVDQRPLEQREDVLSFSSAPLERDMEVTGCVVARIFVATSAADADVAVRLCDVYPDGRSILVADGIRRLTSLLPPGDERDFSAGAEVEVSIGPTSMVFARGHRLRVSIAGSNWPRYEIHGERAFRHTVLVGAPHPTRIVLPVARR